MADEQDRRVFRAQCGPCEVVADPIRVWRRLLSAPGIDGDIQQPWDAVSKEPEEGQAEQPGDVLARCDAEERLAEATRHAFELPAFGGGKGPNEGECLALFWEYMGRLDFFAMRQGSPPTSAPPTAPGS